MVQKNHIEKSFGFLLLLVGLFSLHSLARMADGSGSCIAYTSQQCPCYVEIDGSVPWPGVYEFQGPPTLGELIRAAGGLLPHLSLKNASEGDSVPCLSAVSICKLSTNCAMALMGEINAFHKLTLGLKLDINCETIEGLTAVPGIGIKTAESIVRLRQKKGRLMSLDELLCVPGIGPRSIKRLSKYLTLDMASQGRSNNCP